MSKVLKLKNYLLLEGERENSKKSLVLWLSEQMLHGRESRNRTRFIKLISDRYQEVNTEKKRLLELYCDKNKKKENIYLDKEGKDTTDKEKSVMYKISKDNIVKFNKEYQDFLKEEYKIDITPANSEIINDVKNTILNTSASFSNEEAELYNEWCEIFEEVDNKKK
jgi:hypothetical protein